MRREDIIPYNIGFRAGEEHGIDEAKKQIAKIMNEVIEYGERYWSSQTLEQLKNRLEEWLKE